MRTLLQKIKAHDAKVVVIGIGYVGLPLCVEMARAGFSTMGLDYATAKVEAVCAGTSYIKDVPNDVLAPLVKAGKLGASTDPSVLKDADVVIICVPTPLNKTKEPDNSFVMSAADDLKQHLHKDMLVVLESTTFPSFTRELLLPKLAESGLEVGRDYFLCFSPERVDPGNEHWHTKNTPKVVGGITPNCLEVIQAMYGEVLDKLIPVSSTTRPRWSRCSRTPSAPSTSASSTRSRSCATSSASTPGRCSTPRRRNRSASCASTRALASGVTASRSIRSTCRGR